MGTASNCKAVYGLSGNGTPAATNISGTVAIGIGSTPVNFATCNIAYSFRATTTTSGDVVTLTLSTGVAAGTSGSPTIVDGDGKDFEGATLPTMAQLFGIVIKLIDDPLDDAMTFVAPTAIGDGTIQLGAVFSTFFTGTAGYVVGGNTIVFSPPAADMVFEVTVVGKTA